MDTDQVSIFFALLAFIALAVGFAALAIVAVGKAEKLRPIADFILPLAFVVALTSTLGSPSGLVGEADKRATGLWTRSCV